MNISKKQRLGAVVLAAAIATAAGSLVATPAFAAGTSLGPVWIVSTDDGSALTNPINWKTGSVGLAATQTVSDFKSHFVLPTGAASAVDFIATPGTEDVPSGYLGTSAGDLGFVTFEAPDTLSNNPNLPDFHTKLAAGGTFSLGVAYLSTSGAYLGSYFTAITIVGGQSTMTYVPPASASAPTVTTQPTSQTVVAGSNVTFTAAATGSDSVKWQSAPSASTTFTDISGATSASLTVSNVQAAQAGNQYRAVFTNSTGSTPTSAAVLTVTAAVPTQPTGSGSAGTANVAQGAHTFAFTFPTTVAAGTYDTWGWSTATQLPSTTVAADHTATIDVTGLPAGSHTIGLYTTGTTNLVAWVTITIPQPTNQVALSATVTTSNTFTLTGVAPALDLGSTPRGGTTSNDLPAFTVTDDRNSLPGWDLTTSVANFVNDGVAFSANAGDVVDKSALTVEPRKVGAAVNGIAVAGSYPGSASNEFAQGLVNSSTAASGTQFDAKLTFAAPTTAKAGKYTSTLTFTLTSKS